MLTLDHIESPELTSALSNGIVALLYSADEPLEIEQLASALEASRREVERAVTDLLEIPPPAYWSSVTQTACSWSPHQSGRTP